MIYKKKYDISFKSCLKNEGERDRERERKNKKIATSLLVE